MKLPRSDSRRLLALSLSLALGTAACAQSPDRTARVVPAFDTLPGGVLVVRNSGPAEWADTNGWYLTLERTIRTVEESDGALSNPGGIVANPAGDIYVLDRGPAVIRHYSAEGAFLGLIGREGQGPGEFSDYGILYLVGDTLVHHDQSQARLTLFDRDGVFLGSVTTVSHIGMQMVADETGLVPLPISVPIAGGGERGGAVRYRLTGEIVDTILEPSFPDPPSWDVSTERGTMGMLVPFAAAGWTALTQSGRMLFGYDNDPTLYLSGIGRDTVLQIELPLPALEISDSVRRATVDETIAAYPLLALVAHVEDIPKVLPRWQELRTDAAGNIWVLSHPAQGGLASWYVVRPDGVLRGQVPAPFTDVTVSYWTADQIYRIAEDEAGVPGIEVWRVVKTVRRTPFR